MKTAILASLTLVLCFLNTACAHMVRIDSAPGSEIFVNGRDVGASPATYNETSGFNEQVSITAKLPSGQENTVHVARDNLNMSAAVAGTAGTLAVSLILPIAIFVGGPVTYVCWMHELPDSVSVPLDVAAPKVAVATEPKKPLDYGY